MTLDRRPTRCRHCKVKFTEQERARGHVLHEACIEAWCKENVPKLEKKRVQLARKRAAEGRKELRARKQAMKTIAQLIADAQVSFNAFIRERDKDKGCFVCKRPFEPIPGRVQHAGHVRSRGAAGHLRFNEDNCHGECEGCNGPRGAKPHQIKAGAIERIGQAKFDALEADNTPHKWSRDELIAIKETYRQKRKELEAQRA